MGNRKWNTKILAKDTVTEFCEKYRTSIRVEVYDGSPHLQVYQTNKAGKSEYVTIGRIRKSLYKTLDLELMIAQPGFVNVSWYKFKVKSVKP